MFKTKQRGFTLIELLVVISIIGILSSVVLSAMNTARTKSRDAQRVRDLTEMRKALELYYDRNGRYPGSGLAEYSSAASSPGWNSASNPLYAVVTQGFLSRLPVDPKNTPSGNYAYGNSTDYAYYYAVNASGSMYELVTRLETSGNPSSCQVRGTTYCASVVWGGWNWGDVNTVPDAGKIVYLHQ